MPTAVEPYFPFSIVILAYVATGALILILLMLLRMSSQLGALSIRLTKSSRSSKLTDAEAMPNISEAEPGTPFDEFLNEDPERRNLAKKEQFKAYRKWRADKGLNWAK